MKRPSLKAQFEGDDSSEDDQTTDALIDALSSNDKVIEIRPANQSNGMGMKGLLLLGVGAIAFAYWVRKSQKPKEVIGNLKEETADRTQQAAETIEEGTETASDRIEAGSDRAGERVEEAGETIKHAGDEAAERTEDAGETAADETDSEASRFSDN